MILRQILRGIPWQAWAIAGVLAVMVLAYASGRHDGYQKATRDRAEAVQKAKERADEITDEIDSLDDDGLIDGLLKSD